jgi:hypothetical protein
LECLERTKSTIIVFTDSGIKSRRDCMHSGSELNEVLIGLTQKFSPLAKTECQQWTCHEILAEYPSSMMESSGTPSRICPSNV